MSRSAALQHAIRVLCATELASDYEAASDELIDTQTGDDWDSVAGDGLSTYL